MRSRLAILFALAVVVLLVTASGLFAWKQHTDFVTPVQAKQGDGQIRLRNTAGEVRFSHMQHGGAACMDCHHQTSDANPYRRCHDCHQVRDGKSVNAEHAFHQTCINCHERVLRDGKTAPSRRCSSCHAQGR